MQRKSDHVPLFLDTGDVVKNDPLFIFENAWLMREGIDDLVSNTWRKKSSKESSIENWQCKMRNLRPVLKGWNRNMNAWYRELKKEILIKLDTIDKNVKIMV